MNADLFIKNIKKCYTPFHRAPVHGEKMKDIKIFENISIAVKNGKIMDLGVLDEKAYISESTKIVDAKNFIVLPGLIDSHTHLVHYGSRENEAMLLMAGVPYLEILKQGGGILSTVRDTRAATFEQLYNKAEKVLSHMLSFGVTSVEAKSGYGLDFDTEIKQLEVAKALNRSHPIDIYSTYLGAHAIPKEHINNREDYIQLIKKTLTYIKNHELASAVDVFMEEGAFNYQETKEIFTEAIKLGFSIHMHADEIVSLRGASLGMDFLANSIDHLMAISNEDIHRLKDTSTIANLLPTTSFFLNKDFANARDMIAAGAAVAISSDYNPGSAPSESYQFALQLAFNKMKMHPYEILTASTINPAFSLGIADKVGSIEIGKQADLILLDVNNLESAFIDLGTNHIKQVYKNGKLVIHNVG